jgi:hypothetical protein
VDVNEELDMLVKPIQATCERLESRLQFAVPGTQPGLVGLWTFNEGTGAVARDTSDNANNAALVNSPSFVVSPRGYAVKLNGINQYINFGAPAALNLRGAFSIAAWVKLEALPAGEPLIFGKDTTLFGLTYYSTGQTYFYGGTSGTNNLASAISTGVWHHIVGTTDPTASGVNTRLYVDGVEVASRTSLGAPTDNLLVNLLAGTNMARTAFLKGQIDELRLYDRAITASEVTADFSAGAVRTIYVKPTQNLEALIDNLGFDNTQFVLSAGTFNVSGDMAISRKRVQIIGQGRDQTIIKAASSVYITFRIENGVEDLKIHKLKIEGTPVPAPADFNTHGIGATGSATTVRRVTFKDLTVSNLGVGISIGGGPGNTYDSALVENNIVSRCLGSESGHGYGLHNDSASNVLMRGNYIEKCERHSIYQGRGDINSNIVIENNFIINHNDSGVQPRPHAATVSLARTSGVRFSNNYIVAPRCYALSVEYDEYNHNPTVGVTLVNNRIIGAYHIGLWGNTGTVITHLATSILKRTTNTHQSYLLENNYDPADPLYGQPTTLVVPNARWNNPDFVTELNGKIYVMKNGTLDEIDPSNWTYRTSPTNWTGSVGMTSTGNRLYIVQGGILHELNPTDWTYRYSAATNWTGMQFMTGVKGLVCILQNGVLHKVDPTTWAFTYNAGAWSGVQSLYSWNGNLYCMQNNLQYQINPDFSKTSVDPAPSPTLGGQRNGAIRMVPLQGVFSEISGNSDVALERISTGVLN